MVGVRPAHGSVGEDERSDGCDHAALFCCDLIFMIWAALYSHKSELQVQVFDLWAPLLDWCDTSAVSTFKRRSKAWVTNRTGESESPEGWPSNVGAKILLRPCPITTILLKKKKI